MPLVTALALSAGLLTAEDPAPTFKSDDHRVFTSSFLQKDGTWTTFVTLESRRRKP